MPPRDTFPDEAQAATPAPEISVDDALERRYHRIATIGQGGMGEVLLSRDERIGRDVAMKVMRARGAAPPDQQARFLREARVQGQLEHPAIVPIYDLCRDIDGAPYFTMKRVNGVTLEAVLDKLAAGDAEAAARHNRRKLLGAFVQIGQAVDYAHARGVLHRDLKPANIMLGGFGEVYLLDWGVARLAGDELAAGSGPQLPVGGGRTEHGAILGTPGYMSPEQVRGQQDQLDPRSDVYALGSILFEILALVPLHRGAGVSEILVETLAGVDPRARERAPERDIPPELEAIVDRATRLERAERFASAGEMCAAIERYLDGDRDLALRRVLADGHAALAHAAADRAFSDESDLESRRTALREVGRALALAPEHPGAMRELSRLLARPPRRMPDEARVEINNLARDGQRRAAKQGFVSYLLFLAFLPLGLWMGVHNWWAALLPAPLWLLAALLHLRTARRPHPAGKMPVDLILVGMLAIGSLALIFGPLILVPSVMVVNTVSLMMNRDPGRRPLIIAAGLFAVLLPLALESVGVLPASYLFVDDSLVVVSNALHLPPVQTKAMLLLASLSVIVIAALLIARMRDDLSSKENQMYLHAWQLQQLVPEDISGPISGPPLSSSHPECVLAPLRVSNN